MRWRNVQTTVLSSCSGARSLVVSVTPRCSIGVVSLVVSTPSHSQSPTVDVDRRLSLSQQPSARRPLVVGWDPRQAGTGRILWLCHRLLTLDDHEIEISISIYHHDHDHFHRGRIILFPPPVADSSCTVQPSHTDGAGSVHFRGTGLLFPRGWKLGNASDKPTPCSEEAQADACAV